MIDFFEFSNEMLCVASAQGYFLRVNRAWTKALGWSAEELTARPYLDFVHPDDREATIREASMLVKSRYETVHFENRYRCRDGSYRWLAWQAVLGEGSSELVAAARDVTEQKEQAEALRQSEERFRTLANHAPVGIAEANAIGEIFFVNSKWCELAAVSPEETLGFKWQEFVHPQDRAGLLAAWQTALMAGNDMPAYEFRFVRRSGEIRWASSSVAMLKQADGCVIGQIAAAEDITDRKQTEIALREAEERFRLLAQQAPVGIYLSDEAAHCTFVNHHWCEICAAQPEDALGEGWHRFIYPDDLESLFQAWRQSVERDEGFKMEYRYVRSDGEVRWVDGSAVILRNEQGEIIGHVGTVMDITARKSAADALQAEQELLRQSIELQERERQMIAYDIHDGIVQYAAGALMFLEGYKGRRPGVADSEEIEPALSALRNAIADGRRVMNGIRPPLLDDAGAVAAIGHLAGEKQSAAVEIEFVADPDFGRLKPELEATLYRIAQEALFNAVKHSRSPKVRITLRRGEARVELTIQDWGIGFAPGRAARGVHGLSGIAQRVRLAGGECAIESIPGEGTRIHVELPLVESRERLVPQQV